MRHKPVASSDDREHDVKHGTSVDDVSVPRHKLDSTWSWVVNAAVFSVQVLMVGVQRSYGLFYVAMEDKYDVPATLFSLVGGVFSAVFSIGAIITMTFLLEVVSERQSILMGTVIATSACCISSLITSFPVFILTLGGMYGLTVALYYGPMFLLLGKYFHRHLTLANAIGNTGSGVGGFVVPFVVRAILDEFSFPAGLLLVGGVLCHVFIFAMLLRPVSQTDFEIAKRYAERLDAQAEKGEDDEDDKIDDGTADVDDVTADVDDVTADVNDVTADVKPGTADVKPGTADVKGGTADAQIKQSDGGKRSEILKSNELHKQETEIPTLTYKPRLNNSATDVQSQARLHNDSLEGRPRRTELELVKESFARPRTYSESVTNVHRPYRKTDQKLHASLQNFPSGDHAPGEFISVSVVRDRKELSFLEKLSRSNIAMYTAPPEVLYASSLSIVNVVMLDQEGKTVSRKESGEKPDDESLGSANSLTMERETSKPCCAGKSLSCDWRSYKNVAMWAMVAYQAFGLITGVAGNAFIPPLAREKGLTDTEATFLLTLIGGLDIVSRLLPGVIAHYGLMTPDKMSMLALITQGLLCQLLAFFNTFSAMVGFCVVWGLLSGVYFTMSQTIVVQFMGVRGFRTTFGLMMLFNGISLSVSYPVIGALKDLTGTYETSFQFMGSTQFVAAAILMTLPFCCRLQRKIEAKRQNAYENSNEMEISVSLTKAE